MAPDASAEVGTKIEYTEPAALLSAEFLIDPELQARLEDFSSRLACLERFREESIGRINGDFAGFTRPQRRTMAPIMGGEDPADYIYGMITATAHGQYMVARLRSGEHEAGCVQETPTPEQIGIATAVGIFADVVIQRFPGLASLKEEVSTIGAGFTEQLGPIIDDVEGINDVLIDNNVDPYTLLKYYTLVDLDKGGPEAALVVALELGHESLDGNKSMVTRFLELYDDDTFSDKLSQEISASIFAGDGESAIGEDLRNLAGVVAIIRACSDAATEDLARRFWASSDLIPRNVHLELQEFVRRFTQAIASQKRRVDTLLEVAHLSGPDTLRRLEERDKFARKLGRIASGGKMQGGRGGPVVTKRRVIQSQSSNGSAATEPETETTPEVVREPYKVFLHGHTEALDTTKEEAFHTVMDTQRPDLLKIAGFEAELRRVVDHLAKIDFSNGLQRGTSKNKFELLVDGEPVESYSLKPFDVPGLSLATKAGKKLRILFRITEAGYEILEIKQRDEMQEYFKNHNAGNARSKGGQK